MTHADSSAYAEYQRIQDETEQGSLISKQEGLLLLFFLLGIALLSVRSYIVFHTIAELVTICISFTIALTVANTYRIFENDFFTFLGISYAYIGVFDLLHTLAFEGLGVFGDPVNVAAKMWLIARAIETFAMLASFYFFPHPLRPTRVIVFYTTASVLLLLSVFYWQVFPSCFVVGEGLTTFKKGSEYIISSLLLLAIYMLSRHQDRIHPTVYKYMLISFVTTIGTEIAFTFYVRAYGLSNMVGHLLKLVAFYCIYKAFAETSLRKPYNLLFYQLTQSNRQLGQRTQELSTTNELLKKEIACRKETEDKLHQELVLASNIQRGFLPPGFANKWISVGGLYVPSHFVSGDLYGYHFDEEQRILFGFVIDVMGHGIPTALQTSALKVLFLQAAEENTSLAEKLAKINHKIAPYFADGSFVAAICFEFDCERRELCYASAGIHTFLRTAKGKTDTIKVPGMLLGVFQDAVYDEHRMRFEKDETFVFVTDGFSEALSADDIATMTDYQALLTQLDDIAKNRCLSDDAAALFCHIMPE
jgi:hypothetical protein